MLKLKVQRSLLSSKSLLELSRTLEIPDWGFSSSPWWGCVYMVPTDIYTEFQLSILNLRVQRSPLSSKSWLELWWTLEVPDWGLGSWSWWGCVYDLSTDPYTKFELSKLKLKVQRSLLSSKTWLELWRTLEIPDWGFSSSPWWGCVFRGPMDIYTKFQLSWLSLKVQRSLLSSKPSWLELWKTLEFPDWGFIIQCILKKAYNVQ